MYVKQMELSLPNNLQITRCNHSADSTLERTIPPVCPNHLSSSNHEEINYVPIPFRIDRSRHNKTLHAEYNRQIKRIQKRELNNILQPYHLTPSKAEEMEYEKHHLTLFPPDEFFL